MKSPKTTIPCKRGRVFARAKLALLAATLVVALAHWASPSDLKLLPKLWRSETSGNSYRVAVSGELFQADWVKLPAVMARHGAYVHTECHRQGAKWVGTSSSLLPCTVGQGPDEHLAQWCKIQTRTEIDSLSSDRITGHGQTVKKVDCQTCKLLDTGWAAWTWTPER